MVLAYLMSFDPILTKCPPPGIGFTGNEWATSGMEACGGMNIDGIEAGGSIGTDGGAGIGNSATGGRGVSGSSVSERI
jgi:hypothetical protein